MQPSVSPDRRLVVFARLVQGAGGRPAHPAELRPDPTAVLRAPSGAIAFGYFGTTVGVASATGPILGGALIALFGPENGWRYIFGINVPIGLVAIVLVWRWVPKRSRTNRGSAAERHLDLVGAGLLGAAVLCVLLPTVEAQSGGGLLWLLALGAPVFTAAFVLWERRLRRAGRAPLLDIELLRLTPGYASGIAVGTVYFTGFTGIFLVLSIFLQQGAGYPALQAGLLLTPFAVGAAVMAPIAGRLVSRIGRRITVIALARDADRRGRAGGRPAGSAGGVGVALAGGSDAGRRSGQWRGHLARTRPCRSTTCHPGWVAPRAPPCRPGNASGVPSERRSSSRRTSWSSPGVTTRPWPPRSPWAAPW